LISKIQFPQANVVTHSNMSVRGALHNYQMDTSLNQKCIHRCCNPDDFRCNTAKHQILMFELAIFTESKKPTFWVAGK
jgi:hypothetical protein